MEDGRVLTWAKVVVVMFTKADPLAIIAPLHITTSLEENGKLSSMNNSTTTR